MSALAFIIILIRIRHGSHPSNWQMDLWLLMYAYETGLLWVTLHKLRRKKNVLLTVNKQENAELICRILKADQKEEIYKGECND